MLYMCVFLYTNKCIILTVNIPNGQLVSFPLNWCLVLLIEKVNIQHFFRIPQTKVFVINVSNFSFHFEYFAFLFLLVRPNANFIKISIFCVCT